MDKKSRRKIRVVVLLLLLLLLLNGCAGKEKKPELNRYQTSYLDLFDTVTSIVGYAPSETAFEEETKRIYEGLLRYHQVYDIYHEYPGMVNLCSLNAHAGETMRAEPEILDLLAFAQRVCDLSGRRTDVTMGALLSVWHEAREAGIANPAEARLPAEKTLREAAAHRGFDRVEIDTEHETIRFTDPQLRLDAGALAKGYAVQRVGQQTPSGYLISAGGNVYATGPRADGSDWTIGIQDPDGDYGAFLHKLNLSAGAVVTSGDYQRYYVVDGKTYHHIIDPETLYPGTQWRAVTVICGDSGMADALSTSLFLLSREEGQTLLDQLDAEAMWMDREGRMFFSPGYASRVRP